MPDYYVHDNSVLPYLYPEYHPAPPACWGTCRCTCPAQHVAFTTVTSDRITVTPP
jgi:hypothetical protein